MHQQSQDSCALWYPEASPLLEEYLNELGHTLLQAGETARAIDIFRFNVNTYPRSPRNHHSLAHAFEAAGRMGDALDGYQRAFLEALEMGHPDTDRLRRDFERAEEQALAGSARN